MANRPAPNTFTFYLVLLPFTFYLLPFALAQACPGCKEALFDPAELPQRLSAAKGYALSIGLLLAVPAALVGGLTWLIVRAQRRRNVAPKLKCHGPAK